MFHITMSSNNKKTGAIPVTTTSAMTCPTACPFNHANQGGCYAESGPLAMHWKAVTEGKRGGTLDALVDAIKRIPRGMVWRHNQAGVIIKLATYQAKETASTPSNWHAWSPLIAVDADSPTHTSR